MSNEKSPKEGETVYVVYLGEEPVEVTKYPSRASYRAKEWSVPGKDGVVASAVIRSVRTWGDKPSISDEAHAAECGLGDDCPRAACQGGWTGLVEGGSLPVEAQLEFDFSDEEPTVPNRKECKCR